MIVDQSIDEGLYEGASLVFSNGDLQLKTQVNVNVTLCQINSISFKEKLVQVDYKIGTGVLNTILPELVQEPNCEAPLVIKTVNSQIEKDIILSTVNFDAFNNTLSVETNDFVTFQNQIVTIMIGVDSDITIPEN